MTMGNFAFTAQHRNTLTDVEIFDLYAGLCASRSLGEVTHFWLKEFTDNELVPGNADIVRARLKERPRGLFQFRVATGVELSLVLEAGSPRVWAVHERSMKLDAANLERVIGLCEALFRLPDPPSFIGLARDEHDLWVIPKPPIARLRHAVSTTEDEVRAAYDDPSVFWSAWSTVLEAGDRRLCIRAANESEVRNYLARTFNDNMALAHHARPGLTEYRLPDLRLQKRLQKEYSDWWELGPVADEKAGLPALTFLGHDPSADVFHYSGFIQRDGKEENGRVQLRELIEVKDRCYSDEGEDAPGRVHVVFLEEWMARQERRPLLDVGARVFYYAKDGTKVEVTE